MKLSSLEFGRRVVLIGLAVVLAGLLGGEFFTRGGDPSLAYNAPPVLSNTVDLVDERPLDTARSLAAEAATPQERAFAEQAVNAADHEVDQAFATALRDATTNAPPLSGWALTYSRRIDAMADRVKEEQQQVADLKQAQATASDQDKALAQVGLAQAQLELDIDALADLHQDLIRVDGDRGAKIQQALDQHEAVQKQTPSVPQNTPNAALESPDGLRSLPGKFRALGSLNRRHTMLWQARLDAFALAADLTRKHDELEKQLESASGQAAPENRGASAADTQGSGSTATVTAAPGNGVQKATTVLSAREKNPSPAPATSSTVSPSASSANALAPVAAKRVATPAMNRLKLLTEQRRKLAEWSGRIHDEQTVAMAYENWDQLVVAQRRTVLHRILQVFVVIVIVLLIVVFTGVLIRSLFTSTSVDHRRLVHLRIIAELFVQAAGVIFILLVIFGPPRQMPTIIGLATAGLTVVLKDFIVAFFGWFVLMGRNGMRIGDWVEINGVGGEVVEIGLMRTVLLETGSFSEIGHPTGRRITFLNSFAIEGRYFNFSTAGQWLWDELQVTVPPGAESYQKVEEIRAAVAKTTDANAKLAAAEWKKSTRSYTSEPISTEAAVDLRPVPEGLAVTVRYITRAPERYAMRTRLYHDVIGILHIGPVPELTPSEMPVGDPAGASGSTKK